MKIRTMWIWGKHFLMLITMALLFTIGIPESKTTVISVDNDVGITMSEDINTNMTIAENFEFETRLNYAEVGIVQGDNLNIVSNYTNEKTICNETLLGSINLDNRQFYASTYNEGKMILESNTSTYKTQKKTLNYNSHFRLARSRMVLSGEYIA